MTHYATVSPPGLFATMGLTSQIKVCSHCKLPGSSVQPLWLWAELWSEHGLMAWAAHSGVEPVLCSCSALVLALRRQALSQHLQNGCMCV